MTLLGAGAMPASQIVNPTIDVAGAFQQGRQDAAVNTSNDISNQVHQIEMLASGAAHALPQGPNGPVDPDKWNEVLTTFEQTGMDPAKVKQLREHPEIAAVVLKGSANALKAQSDAATFDKQLQLLDAQIAQALSVAQHNLAGPTPTDDQRELAQINTERKAKNQPELSMEEFLASKKSGMALSVGPDGTVQFTQGGGKLTEAQGKDIGFYTRGLQANEGLGPLETQLTDWGQSKADMIPLGLGNYLKTPEFRQAKVEADNFLASILRKDSGAAITAQEFGLYGPMFLPVPGDDAGTIALKRQKRATALMAIRSGLGTAEAVAAANEGALNLDTPTDEAAGTPAEAPAPAAAPPPDKVEETQTIDGKKYVKRNGEWFEAD